MEWLHNGFFPVNVFSTVSFQAPAEASDMQKYQSSIWFDRSRHTMGTTNGSALSFPLDHLSSYSTHVLQATWDAKDSSWSPACSQSMLGKSALRITLFGFFRLPLCMIHRCNKIYQGDFYNACSWFTILK